MAAKARRGSVANMMFGKQKESSLLLAPQLVLKRCVSQASTGGGKVATKVTEHPLQLPGSNAAKSSGTGGARETPHLSATTVVNLFGGPVLNINTLNAKEAEAMFTAAALAKRQADAALAATAAAEGKGRPAGPPQAAVETEDDGSRMIEDVEATTREVRSTQPPIAAKQVSNFYTLVSAKWLKARVAQEAAVAASALAAKDKTQKKPKKQAGVAESHPADETGQEGAPSGHHHGESPLQLIAVGPSVQHAEIVRWDFQRNLCALVQSGSSAISLLQLQVHPREEDGGYPHLDLVALRSVDVCVPSSLRMSALCGLTWAQGVLYATEEAGGTISAIYCSQAAGIQARLPEKYPPVHSGEVMALTNYSPVWLHLPLCGYCIYFYLFVIYLFLTLVLCPSDIPCSI